MLKAINPNARIPVPFPNGEESSDEKVTVFYLRPLTVWEWTEILSLSDDLTAQQKAFIMLEYALVGWDNLEGAEFDEQDPRGSINKLPMWVYLELATKAQEFAGLKEKDRGNFELPSTIE